MVEYQNGGYVNIYILPIFKKLNSFLCSDVGLWVTRIATIIFTFGYIIPVFGNPTQSYYKVFPGFLFTAPLRFIRKETTSILFLLFSWQIGLFLVWYTSIVLAVFHV
jgi:hypothetical protein